jgi:hypothetical protein
MVVQNNFVQTVDMADQNFTKTMKLKSVIILTVIAKVTLRANMSQMGIIKLEEQTIEELQLKAKRAMLKFVIKRTG